MKNNSFIKKKYPRVWLKSGREKSVLNFHPWIFSGSILKQDSGCSEGDIVEVCTFGGDTLAYGHYSLKASISCRIFHFGNISGDFDEQYWFQKFSNAREARIKFENPQTNAWRWIFAEGDNLPGLILDIYDDVAVIQARTTGMKNLLPTVTQWLQKQKIRHTLLKEEKGSSSQDIENEWIYGKKPLVSIIENSLVFQVNVENGQKTGFYLDQRENRALFRHYASNRDVLNVCCYSGAFSIYALAGGAKSIVSVDISKNAIEQAKFNVDTYVNKNINTSLSCDYQVSDCFEWLKKMPENRYDLIVLDPPAFSKSQSSLMEATRGYKEINMKAIRKIRPGGMLFTFSCSQHIEKQLFQKIIFAAAADAKRTVRILHQLHQAPDHPINIFHPEGEYLKGFVLEVY